MQKLYTVTELAEQLGRKSPEALASFWRRIAEDETRHPKFKRISRHLSPHERAAMLEALMIDLPASNKQLAKKNQVQ